MINVHQINYPVSVKCTAVKKAMSMYHSSSTAGPRLGFYTGYTVTCPPVTEPVLVLAWQLLDLSPSDGRSNEWKVSCSNWAVLLF